MTDVTDKRGAAAASSGNHKSEYLERSDQGGRIQESAQGATMARESLHI
jgi:hypothetical protein